MLLRALSLNFGTLEPIPCAIKISISGELAVLLHFSFYVPPTERERNILFLVQIPSPKVSVLDSIAVCHISRTSRWIFTKFALIQTLGCLRHDEEFLSDN